MFYSLRSFIMRFELIMGHNEEDHTNSLLFHNFKVENIEAITNISPITTGVCRIARFSNRITSRWKWNPCRWERHEIFFPIDKTTIWDKRMCRGRYSKANTMSLIFIAHIHTLTCAQSVPLEAIYSTIWFRWRFIATFWSAPAFTNKFVQRRIYFCSCSTIVISGKNQICEMKKSFKGL